MGLEKFRKKWLAKIEELENKYAETGSDEDRLKLEECKSNFAGKNLSTSILLHEFGNGDTVNSDFFLNPRVATIEE